MVISAYCWTLNLVLQLGPQWFWGFLNHIFWGIARACQWVWICQLPYALLPIERGHRTERPEWGIFRQGFTCSDFLNFAFPWANMIKKRIPRHPGRGLGAAWWLEWQREDLVCKNFLMWQFGKCIDTSEGLWKQRVTYLMCI